MHLLVLLTNVMATQSDELFPLLLHSHHKIKTMWNTASQVMDEVFNQLAGSTVPVVALVETLAEFASSHGRCIIINELWLFAESGAW